MKKDLLIVLLGIVPLISHAEVITEGQAEATAYRFFTGSTGRQSRASNVPLKMVWNGLTKTARTATNEIPSFYVFNRGDDQGFVIISGDDATKPVLGYSYEGTFGVENMPENLKKWMNRLHHQITGIRQKGIQPTAEVKEAWDQMGANEVVVKMETPVWNQTSPYSDKTPYHYYTGCTITATAIVMGYHQWPDCGVGELKGYTANGIQVEGVTLGYPYRWDKMPYLNGNSFDWQDAEQADAVATLMRDLGVMGRAAYSWQGTTADPEIMAFKLPRHMKYSESIMHLKHEFFSEGVWQQMMKSELDALRPILYAGYNFSSGHAFVLDGYDAEGLFSVNWGWGGMSNGFFDLTTLDPSQQGAGGSNAGYDTDQEAVLHIFPNRPEDALEYYEKLSFVTHSVSGSLAGMGLQVTEPGEGMQQGSTITISAGALVNLGSSRFESHMKLAITDAQGRIKRDLYTSPGMRNMSPGSITMPLDELRDFYTLTLEDPIQAGDRIRLLYLSKNGQWKPVTCDEPDGQWEIVLKQGEVIPTPLEVQTVSGLNLGSRALCTFSSMVPTRPSANEVEAFYAEAKDNQTISLKRIEPQGNQLVIPANTGVLLATEGELQFTMEPSNAPTAIVPETNLLHPTTAEGIHVAPSVNAYILGKKTDNVLFYTLSDNDRKIAANRSYLILPSQVQSPQINFAFDEATGIDSPTADQSTTTKIYDLTGRQVHHISKGGLYIKNGKKVFMK